MCLETLACGVPSTEMGKWDYGKRMSYKRGYMHAENAIKRLWKNMKNKQF